MRQGFKGLLSLGLNFGLDLNRPGLRLPAIGRLGFDDALVSERNAASVP